jgi:hypothetical protein
MNTPRTAAVVAACWLSVACSTQPAPAPASSAPPATQDKAAVVSWVAGYCASVKDMVLQVYQLPKEADVVTDADLPMVAAALESLDAKLRTAVSGLEKLPRLEAQDANAVVADRLAFYRKLLSRVTEYRAMLPGKGVRSAKSALTVLGVDMVTYKPAHFATDVPGFQEVMKANADCKLVA